MKTLVTALALATLGSAAAAQEAFAHCELKRGARNFVFADGHAKFLTQTGDSIHDTFFDPDDTSNPQSVNVIKHDRSNYIQTID